MRQGSVPVAGFSRELRSAPDVERWWFEARDPADRRVPVHIVFSPSTGVAEVKHSAAKALRLTDVTSAADARSAWLASISAPRPTGRSHRVLEELAGLARL